jgi:hypothetical protein
MAALEMELAGITNNLKERQKRKVLVRSIGSFSVVEDNIIAPTPRKLPNVAHSPTPGRKEKRNRKDSRASEDSLLAEAGFEIQSIILQGLEGAAANLPPRPQNNFESAPQASVFVSTSNAVSQAASPPPRASNNPLLLVSPPLERCTNPVALNSPFIHANMQHRQPVEHDLMRQLQRHHEMLKSNIFRAPQFLTTTTSSTNHGSVISSASSIKMNSNKPLISELSCSSSAISNSSSPAPAATSASSSNPKELNRSRSASWPSLPAKAHKRTLVKA